MPCSTLDSLIIQPFIDKFIGILEAVVSTKVNIDRWWNADSIRVADGLFCAARFHHLSACCCKGFNKDVLINSFSLL